MPFVIYGNHNIEIKFEARGEENIFYDGEIVSSKTTVRGGTHNFSVEEEGEKVNYEVKIKPKGGILGIVTGFAAVSAPKIEVRRNGKKIHP